MAEPTLPLLRIAVVGTSGVGKSTLAKTLAQQFGIPHTELDAINWQPDWQALHETDVAKFKRRVAEAASAPAWVIDGNYGPVKDIVWDRATHVVWLDYERPVIMRRVIWRTLKRVFSSKPLWNGNREDWRRIFAADHPIRWAWDTFARRRTEFGSRVAEPRFAHLSVHRLKQPKDALGLAEQIKQG